MKKKLYSTLITLLLTIMTFNGMAFNYSCDSWEQYNNNPEETNDDLLYKYELFLDEGLLTEEEVFIKITQYNNLTNQGVQDLINDGYLHSYIDDLIVAGRLPEGFTPTVSTPETPPVEEPVQDNNTTEQPNNNEQAPASTPATVTCDESINGTFIVIKAETKSYVSHSTSSNKVKTWAMGEEVEVTGLTSNGYYRINDNNSEQYIKESNLVKKDLYDAAWVETNLIESTCTEEGSITYTNSYTDESKTEPLEKKQHQMKTVDKVGATCTTDGYEKKTCSMCGLEQEDILYATGHKEGLVCDDCNQIILFGKGFSPAVVGGVATVTVLSLGGGSILAFRKFKR